MKKILLSLLISCLAQSAHAVIVSSSNLAVTSTSTNPINGSRPLTNLLDYADLSTADETGILANATNSSSASVVAALQFNTSNSNFVYNGGEATTPVAFDIDFTTAETIDSIHLWNFGFNLPTASVRDFTVELFDTGDVSLGTFNFTALEAPLGGTGTIAAQTFSLGSNLTVSRANFILVNNYGLNRVGVSKIAFGTAAIPEPGHFALGFAGITALVICLKRRAATKR